METKNKKKQTTNMIGHENEQSSHQQIVKIDYALYEQYLKTLISPRLRNKSFWMRFGQSLSTLLIWALGYPPFNKPVSIMTKYW